MFYFIKNFLAIQSDENYYDEESYDKDQETDISNLNDNKNTNSQDFFIKLDRSQLREFDFSSFDCGSNDNSKFNDIEQQSPIIEQELLTTEQEIENLKQKLVMSESVSEMTQSVIDSIRKEYSISGEKDEENDNDRVEIDTCQQIDPVVQQVIENLSKDGASDLEKIFMVESTENEPVYDSDLDEHNNLVKSEHEDEKDCLLRSSSSEMSLLKDKENNNVYCENQDTELDQDTTWYHQTDQIDSENLVEKLSLSKQYQTFESSSSSSISDQTDKKDKSNKLVQIKVNEEEKAKNDVCIVIHGSTSSTTDENETKFDGFNLTIDPIKVSESREQLIENDHLQRDHSSYNICSFANDETTIGQSVDDISEATTIVEQQQQRFFEQKCEAFCPSSEAELTDLENSFGIKKNQMYLDIKSRDAINLSESSEPLIKDQQMNQKLISESSASVNSVNSLSNSSHYSLTTSDENMAKNLLDNENVDLSKSSSSSINTEDLNLRNISKSLNFLESLVVPSSLEPNEQIEEYTILLERQNVLDQAKSDFMPSSKCDQSPMKTSQSLNFQTKLTKQMFIPRPNQIDLYSSDFDQQQHNKVCTDFQTPTPVESAPGCFFDKRITSSNEPSIDMFDKTSSDNSEKNDLIVHDSLVDNLISQISDPEHAEEEVVAAIATAYLFSSNVNSQSNEEIKSQVDSVNDDQSENRFCGIDNEAYASSKSSRESVLINYDYDDSLDQQQMQIKVIQSTNPSKSLIYSDFDSDQIKQANNSVQNESYDHFQTYSDMDLSNQSKLIPELDSESTDDQKILINDSSVEFDENLQNEFGKNEKYFNQEKEPLLNDDFVEINDDKIDVDEEHDIVIVSSSDDLNFDFKMNENESKVINQIEDYNANDLVTKDGVVLDDQSFLICTPVNELNAQLSSSDLADNEKFSLIARDLVEETLNKSVEKVWNEIQCQQESNTGNCERLIEDLQEKINFSNYLNLNDPIENKETILENLSDISKEEEISKIKINQQDNIKLDTNECVKLNENVLDGEMRTPVVVLEHVTSEPNSDQEFDPNEFMENFSSSHETSISCQREEKIDEEDRNKRMLAEKIVDCVLTKSIEKLNEDTNEENENKCQSIIKSRSDQNGSMQTNQFGLKEVRFSTISSSLLPQESDKSLEGELCTLQQIILNSNSEKTFNQINKIKSQKSVDSVDSVDSCNELEKIIEDKNEEELMLNESFDNNQLVIEAKAICEHIIDNALKKLNQHENILSDFGQEQNENLSCLAEKIEYLEKVESTMVVDENLDKCDKNECEKNQIELTTKSQLFENYSEKEILEDMQRPLLTSSFMSDTLPSDNDTDQLSYHTAVTGLNESKQNYSSSNYLTAHDDQEQHSQQQMSASDSFYSANSKQKSFDSSILSSFSNLNNNSYNNLDESYSTLNDTNNYSDFERTIVSESNDDSKYEDVQTFIKDMEPLIETNLEDKSDANQQSQLSPKQDSGSSTSSSAVSLDIKCLNTNKMSTNTNSSSPLSFNQQLEFGDNASCTSSILEFEKMEEQCMNNGDGEVPQTIQKDDLNDAYNYYEPSQSILTNDLNTIYEINEKELSSTASSPLTKSELRLEENFSKEEEEESKLTCKSESVSSNQIDLSIDLTNFAQKNKNQSTSATTSPIQSPTSYRTKNTGSTSSLTKQVMSLQQLSNSRSSSSSSIKSTDSFENELKTKVKIDESSYFAKIRLKTPPLLENLDENSAQLDTIGASRKKSSKRTSRTSSSTSNSSSASFQGEAISNKLFNLSSSLSNEPSVLTFAAGASSKQSKLTAEDLPSFKKTPINFNPEQTAIGKVMSSISSSNISASSPRVLQSNQTLSQSSNFEPKIEIHRSSSTHSHHSSDCYCGKSSPSLALTTNVSKSYNPTSSSSCFSFTSN